MRVNHARRIRIGINVNVSVIFKFPSVDKWFFWGCQFQLLPHQTGTIYMTYLKI